MEVAFYKGNDLIYDLSLLSYSIDNIYFSRTVLYSQVAKFKTARWVWGIICHSVGSFAHVSINQ